MTEAFCGHCAFIIDLKAPGVIDRFCDLALGECDAISKLECCPKDGDGDGMDKATQELLDERQRAYAERDSVDKKLVEINKRIGEHTKKAGGSETG